MTDPIASLTKITRPSLRCVVSRPRLFERLDSSLENPIVWVQGPPGSGKTTLLSSYLEQRDVDYLWYQLDPDDNDVATFFYYLRLALSRDFGDDTADDGAGSFSPEFLQDIRPFARRFFRDMYLRLPRPFVIVLDNYQDVQTQSRLHDVIQAAIGELPDGGAMVLMSRSDPIAQMARHRASRRLEHLGWDDLRLTRDETEQLIRLRGDALSRDAIDTLFTLTEGWAAGLVLLMDVPNRDELLAADFAGMDKDVVFDYFAEEAFNAFDTETQEFLLRTACMPRMTLDMVETLTGLRHASRLLKELNRRNYFVSERFTGRLTEYQYHPLFREFLVKLAEDRYSEEHYRELRRRVAGILLDHNHYEAAIEIFLDLEDWDRVAAIIASRAAAMLAWGRSETLAQWLDELPAAALQQDPWMLYWSAAASFHASPRKSRKFFEQAYEAFSACSSPNVRGMVLSCCGASDTILSESDDFAELDPWIARSEALLGSHPAFFEGREYSRVAGTMLMAVVIRQPQHHMLELWIAGVTRLARSGEHSYNRTIVASLAALALLVAGRLSDARTMIQELREFSAAHPVRPQMAVMIDVMDAMDRVLSGNTADCLDVVDRGLETAAHHGYRSWVNLLLAFGAGTALINRDPGRAREYLARIDGGGGSASRLEQSLSHYFRGWASQLAEERVAAFQSFRLALSLSIEVGMPALETLCRSGLARVAFDCGDRRAATSQMRKVHHLVRNIRNPLLEFQTLMTFADLALGDGRTRAGMNALRFGLGLGREHGFDHVMGWRPETVANLCVKALEEDIETDYVKRLITNSRLVPAAPPHNVSAWPWRRRVYGFGRFRFLGEDGTGAGVAGEGRRRSRPLDVLKVMLALGGNDVPALNVAQALWPHVDADYAYKSFTINLHRLRKLFEDDESVVLNDGLLTVQPHHVWFDVWAFEQTLADIDVLLAMPTHAGAESALERAASRMLDLYRGPFLATEKDLPCYVERRAALGAALARSLGRLMQFWERHGSWEAAAQACERAISACPAEESFYRHLIVCHHALGRTAEVRTVYERCRDALRKAGGRELSAETQALGKIATIAD